MRAVAGFLVGSFGIILVAVVGGMIGRAVGVLPERGSYATVSESAAAATVYVHARAMLAGIVGAAAVTVLSAIRPARHVAVFGVMWLVLDALALSFGKAQLEPLWHKVVILSLVPVQMWLGYTLGMRWRRDR